MLESASLALATFFATIGPLDAAAVFAALTAHSSPQHKRTMAIRATIIASIILLIFALFGEHILKSLGISLAALRTGGGILLLLIGIELVFARSSGGTSTTHVETREAIDKPDISIFPIATPLIAGPGAIGASILLMANARDSIENQIIIIAALLAMLFFTGVALILASKIQRIFGVTGMHVISRIMGVLLCSLAVQFIFDGIIESGIFASH